MKLILTRHGLTEENIAGIIQGHLPGKLSKEGIEQAKKLAKRLKSERIDAIYSSDLARAADTTKEIAKYHAHIIVNYVQDLREKFLGPWQGKSKEELGFGKETSLTSVTCEVGESTEELFNRASQFLQTVLKKHSQETVLMVGHNGINRALIAALTSKTHQDLRTIEKLKNTSVCIFEIDENKNYTIISFNCIKHLK
ncbi:histidine phosphatase family protein [Candidatus Beckwithbacteria bacterium]|nr:histidine phosphatase family protein [Candidatus Beckwithbacteria bacterium]